MRPAPGMARPARSPFTSAAKTGTPARLNPSARVCSVTVLPVPVAPGDETVPVGHGQRQIVVMAGGALRPRAEADEDPTGLGMGI